MDPTNHPPPQRLDKKKPEDLPAHPKSIFPAPIGNISSIASMQYFSFAARDEDAQTVQCECMQCALCIVHCAMCIVQCACSVHAGYIVHCACSVHCAMCNAFIVHATKPVCWIGFIVTPFI